MTPFAFKVCFWKSNLTYLSSYTSNNKTYVKVWWNLQMARWGLKGTEVDLGSFGKELVFSHSDLIKCQDRKNTWVSQVTVCAVPRDRAAAAGVLNLTAGATGWGKKKHYTTHQPQRCEHMLGIWVQGKHVSISVSLYHLNASILSYASTQINEKGH